MMIATASVESDYDMDAAETFRRIQRSGSTWEVPSHRRLKTAARYRRGRGGANVRNGAHRRRNKRSFV